MISIADFFVISKLNYCVIEFKVNAYAMFLLISRPEFCVWHIFRSEWVEIKQYLMRTLAGCLLAVIAFILVSFKSFENMDAVVTAIRSGNVTQLSPFFDERVDISLPEKSDTYSKSQAAMVIGDFFNTNVVQNFKISQEGESGGTYFCAGILMTHSGNFRTTIFFKHKGGKHYLQEIRFQSTE